MRLTKKTGATRWLRPFRREVRVSSVSQSNFKLRVTKRNPSSFCQYNWFIKFKKTVRCSSRKYLLTSLALSFLGTLYWHTGATTGLFQNGTDSGGISTCPTSTTSQLRTPVQTESYSKWDDSLWTPSHLLDVSLESYRPTTTTPHAFFK